MQATDHRYRLNVKFDAVRGELTYIGSNFDISSFDF